MIQGAVTIAPVCPVEQAGNPCTASPEAYTSRLIIVYAIDGRTVIAQVHPGPTGTYQTSVSPGTYIIDIAHTGMDHSKDTPRQVVVAPGQTVTVNISIDTGIR